VSGFKSIKDEQVLKIRPLTILAGSNSSGKSSMVQPLLLLKQTLEATYDPGPLLLSGPHLMFTSSEQFLARIAKGESVSEFAASVSIADRDTIRVVFALPRQREPVILSEMTVEGPEGEFKISCGSDGLPAVPVVSKSLELMRTETARRLKSELKWKVRRSRCFFELLLELESGRGELMPYRSTQMFDYHIRRVIHVPGLRGNPARGYPVTAFGPQFPGPFEKYAASVIAHWQDKNEKAKLEALRHDLERLGLTWKVLAKALDQTQLALKVGRLPHPIRGGAHDVVDIADVGFGVSQTLPVVVALHAAGRGQLVYLEQPEIHLHPRAQASMARVIADAASRGVQVLVETHSSTLLLAVQSLVAEGELEPSLVSLNWFARDGGVTHVTAGQLDSRGAFGKWPEDFATVALESEHRYLSAVEARASRRANR